MKARPKCKFGAACYRQNPQHRLDEWHPGDDDWPFKATSGSSKAQDPAKPQPMLDDPKPAQNIPKSDASGKRSSINPFTLASNKNLKPLAASPAKAKPSGSSSSSSDSGTADKSKKRKRASSDDEAAGSDAEQGSKKQSKAETAKPVKGKKAKLEASPSKGSAVNLNKDLTDILAQLGATEKASGNIYKAQAYWKAIRGLSKHDKRIASGKEAAQLTGIGKKIAAKIQEILDTGQLQRLEEDKKDPHLNALKLLNRVYVDMLRKNQHLLNSSQKLGLQFFEDFEQKIPRSEMLAMQRYIEQQLALFNAKKGSHLEFTICGSFRRGAKESGDIDVLLTQKSWKEGQPKPREMDEFVTHLHKTAGFITHDLGWGQKKFSGVCLLPADALAEGDNQPSSSSSSNNSSSSSNSDTGSSSSSSNNSERKAKPAAAGNASSSSSESKDSGGSAGHRPHRRIDIRFVAFDVYWCAVLYFTGPDTLNINMRVKAQELGYKLNEYRLIKLKDGQDGESMPVSSEKDVFDYLKMPFQRPEDR